ncbi:hypothetical protein ABW19_dt0204910 [Dactylella cylindrospora]|nr:hypothetical protein ABW19_dt0204910 [Dactylella cylindrospora]
MACYVLNTDKESDVQKVKCAGFREDYYECLHHTKEIEKVRRLNEAIKRYELGLGAVKDESSMAALGLIKGSYDPQGKDV